MLSKCATGKQAWKHTLPSPAEILHQWPVRTPTGQAPTQPNDFQDIKNKLMERQNKQSFNNNQSHRTKDLPPLQRWHRDGKSEPATVKQVEPEPRSYHCTTKTGKTFRRKKMPHPNHWPS